MHIFGILHFNCFVIDKADWSSGTNFVSDDDYRKCFPLWYYFHELYDRSCHNVSEGTFISDKEILSSFIICYQGRSSGCSKWHYKFFLPPFVDKWKGIMLFSVLPFCLLCHQQSRLVYLVSILCRMMTKKRLSWIS